MKKLIILLLLLSVFITLAGSAGAADDPQALLRTAKEEIFIKAGFSQNYSETQGYVNEFAAGDVLHQYFIKDGVGTEILTSLQPSPANIMVTNKRLAFADRRAKVFYSSYKVKRTEAIPEDAGYCWIRYSDQAVAGAGRECGVILYPGHKAFSFAPVDGTIRYTEIADLSDIDMDRQNLLEVIRMDGVSHFYFNGYFAFKYEDGIANPVSFEGGTELHEGMNRIRCDFDDFVFLTQ